MQTHYVLDGIGNLRTACYSLASLLLLLGCVNREAAPTVYKATPPTQVSSSPSPIELYSPMYREFCGLPHFGIYFDNAENSGETRTLTIKEKHIRLVPLDGGNVYYQDDERNGVFLWRRGVLLGLPLCDDAPQSYMARWW